MQLSACRGGATPFKFLAPPLSTTSRTSYSLFNEPRVPSISFFCADSWCDTTAFSPLRPDFNSQEALSAVHVAVGSLLFRWASSSALFVVLFPAYNSPAEHAPPFLNFTATSPPSFCECFIILALSLCVHWRTLQPGWVAKLLSP